MRTRTCILLTILLWASAGNLVAASIFRSGLTPKQLLCEHRADPLGLDVTEPRLSWIVTSNQRGKSQSAYRILVASNRDLLKDDTGDLWDSGIVESDQTTEVALLRQASAIAHAMLLEGPRLGRGRQCLGLEQAGQLVNGPDRRRDLAGQVDRLRRCPSAAQGNPGGRFEQGRVGLVPPRATPPHRRRSPIACSARNSPFQPIARSPRPCSR